jgi:preprotein translocase subunit SecE
MPVQDREKGMAKAVALASNAGEPQRTENFLTRSREFLGDVRGEMRKVTTPSRAEVQSTTTVVIAAVFAFAAFFYVVDSVLGFALKSVLHWLGGAQ